MNWLKKLSLGALCLTVGAASVSGCADDGSLASLEKNGSLNVSQGGAQDFARFRALVEMGQVPSPDTLDEVGFFAEHAVDLPEATCGNDVCLHPMLAVAPRFDKSNWTMAFLAMNTPVDPSTLERPPLHMLILVENSPIADNIEADLQMGISALVEGLRAEDRVSLVRYGAAATPLVVAAPPDPALIASSLVLTGEQAISMYTGLAGADRLLNDVEGFDAKRIVMLTSGRADMGITNKEHIVGIGEAMVRQGTAIGVVGFGDTYEATLPTALGSLGAGTFSYAPDPIELVEILRAEGETALFPLATDMRVVIKPSEGYKVGAIYGAKRAWVANGEAHLDLPALFIGQRAGAADVGGGRRGGGGGLFVELIADPGAESLGAGKAAFTLEAQWNESGGPASVSEDVINGLAPGQNPETMWPFFSQPNHDKPFMMLNMYLGFRAAVDFYDNGDCARSIGVVDMLAPSVDGWQGKYNDPDIADDNQLLLRLRSNINSACATQGPVSPVQPKQFHGGCMFI